jgi:hypothetical protein
VHRQLRRRAPKGEEAVYAEFGLEQNSEALGGWKANNASFGSNYPKNLLFKRRLTSLEAAGSCGRRLAAAPNLLFD